MTFVDVFHFLPACGMDDFNGNRYHLSAVEPQPGENRFDVMLEQSATSEWNFWRYGPGEKLRHSAELYLYSKQNPFMEIHEPLNTYAAAGIFSQR